jgi:dTDP-4-dehydrorhamnose reductase
MSHNLPIMTPPSRSCPVIILGSTGLLGTDMVAVCHSQQIPTLIPSSTQVDITNPTSLIGYIAQHPTAKIIINCAAYTAVDLCETHREKATLINTAGPQNLANACKAHDRILVHFSTDYVFDGTKTTPYLETDTPNPINMYGQSKLAGELAIQSTINTHYIFRLQWLYGANGPNFVTAILNKAKTNSELRVVNDQWGSPSWTYDIANCALNALYHPIPFGLYHLANSGYTTWYQFASKILQNHTTITHPVASSDYPTLAKRPKNSQLDTHKFCKYAPRTPLHWEDAYNKCRGSTRKKVPGQNLKNLD